MAHHQGMSLLSCAYVLLGRPMQRRFESEPLFQATLLLLQERLPRVSALHAHATDVHERSASQHDPEAAVRMLTTAHTAIPKHSYCRTAVIT
jgi:hypothetical protein